MRESRLPPRQCRVSLRPECCGEGRAVPTTGLWVQRSRRLRLEALAAAHPTAAPLGPVLLLAGRSGARQGDRMDDTDREDRPSPVGRPCSVSRAFCYTSDYFSGWGCFYLSGYWLMVLTVRCTLRRLRGGRRCRAPRAPRPIRVKYSHNPLCPERADARPRLAVTPPHHPRSARPTCP